MQKFINIPMLAIRCTHRIATGFTVRPLYKVLMLTLVVLFTLANAEMLADGSKETVKHGNATYYGNKSHGRRTSSGSVYHRDSLTCAHRTLPFGTVLKVKNKRNGKEVYVTVTDRGPFRRGAVIDLSMAAAKHIDMVRDGVCPVELSLADPSMLKGGIPYARESQDLVLPELQLVDPITGNFYTMAEWQQRDAHRKELAKTNAAKNPENFTAKVQPRYKVVGHSNMAKAEQKEK